jgi:hypothetical protein
MNGIIIDGKVYEVEITTDKEIPCGICDLLGRCSDYCDVFNRKEVGEHISASTKN